MSIRFLISSGLLIISFWFLLADDWKEDLKLNILNTWWKLYVARGFLLVGVLIVGFGIGKIFR